MATKLTDIASINQIIQEMTVREKAACITGDSPFYTRAMEKYGIPKLLFLDGGTGFNINQLFMDKMYQEYKKQMEEAGTPVDEEKCVGRMGGLEIIYENPELLKNRYKYAEEQADDDPERGCYPPGILFGATWNPEVIENCGEQLGEEVNVRGIDVLLGSPNVNIHRDPRNGRLFEGYSEDPCLISGLAPSFVKGIQKSGVIANVKHFAANNQETDRMGVDEHIAERALREIYLPGFEACITAGCKTVMSAYNKINGKACAQNKWLLQDILRGEWGFTGVVVTDWSAAYDQVEAASAGNDVVMPGPRQLNPLVEAVENGRLKESDLDTCVRNFLRIALEAPAIKGRKKTYDKKAGIQAAYQAAKEGITLLKNDGILPLKEGASVAFYGECSRKMMCSGAGSAKVVTVLETNVYSCMSEALGEDRVSFDKVKENTTAIIVTVSANGQEGADRPDMRMEPEDQRVLNRARTVAKEKGLPLIVLLNVAAPIEMVDWEADASAVLCLYIPGMQGGKAAADILLGKANPSGKLPITFPKRYRDCPSYNNFPGYNSQVNYGEGIYVGYRYYEKKAVEVMYPFGYGLSYTTFEIMEAECSNRVNIDEEALCVKVRVKNTGAMAGAEVVQLYVQDVISTLDKPVKELKNFRKVWLECGEEKEISLYLQKKDFASYDCRLEMWATEPGDFKILIGNSSSNIEQILDVYVDCINPYNVGPRTAIVDVVSNTRAVEIAEKIIGGKLKEIAGSYIVFQPLTPFEKVWQQCVVPAIQIDKKTSDRMQKEIFAQWSQL